MIISGGSRRGAGWFAEHFMKTEQGQTVSLPEVRGLAGDNIPYWFAQMRALSLGTKCDNFFYHANINPRDDEVLTPEQWEQATDALEHALGLDGHARFVVEHEKHGRVHRHVVWSRVDPDTMTAVSDSKTYGIHMRTADALEKEFGHEATPRGPGVKGKNPKNYEVFRGQESGISPYDVKTQITQMWERADSGRAFVASLEEHGFILARGRRGFVVVDAEADDHLLSRRIPHTRKAHIDARLADVDITALPSVEEARVLARQRGERKPQEEREEQKPEAGALPDHFAEQVQEAIHEVKELLSGKEEPSPPCRPPTPEPSAFDRFTQELVRDAREAAPVAAEFIDAAAASAPALPAFERFVQGSKEALRTGGEALFIAASLAWLARKLGQSFLGTPPPAEHLTPFESFAEKTKEAMRANGGEPAPGFWQRGVDMLAQARDRALAWVREASPGFVGHLLRSRNTDRNNSGIER
jgi:hypothetical protein